ncbi:MAG: putative porin, partial [Candidatus Omnitrophica bacterium]|nr:putative porin [Candidatus Omnitrophota bacterium]
NAEYSPIDLAVFSYSLPVVLQYSYVSNEAKHVSEKHTAWLAGFKLGKAQEKGSFELFYNYRQIGRDAVLAIINDSDFHLGGTGAKGHKFGAVYQILPNSTIGLTYFITRPYKVVATGANRNINIWQIDWVTKF